LVGWLVAVYGCIISTVTGSVFRVTIYDLMFHTIVMKFPENFIVITILEKLILPQFVTGQT